VISSAPALSQTRILIAVKRNTAPVVGPTIADRAAPTPITTPVTAIESRTPMTPATSTPSPVAAVPATSVPHTPGPPPPAGPPSPTRPSAITDGAAPPIHRAASAEAPTAEAPATPTKATHSSAAAANLLNQIVRGLSLHARVGLYHRSHGQQRLSGEESGSGRGSRQKSPFPGFLHVSVLVFTYNDDNLVQVLNSRLI
jgi:hypothetical protein